MVITMTVPNYKTSVILWLHVTCSVIMANGIKYDGNMTNDLNSSSATDRATFSNAFSGGNISSYNISRDFSAENSSFSDNTTSADNGDDTYSATSRDTNSSDNSVSAFNGYNYSTHSMGTSSDYPPNQESQDSITQYEYVWLDLPPDYTQDDNKACWSDIEQYLNLPDNDPTKQYIMQFSDKTQRDMIAVQLSYCPYTPLCNYTLNEYRSDSCCRPCSCLPDCTEYSSCCPDILHLHNSETSNTTVRSCIPLKISAGKAIPGYTVYGIKHCPTGTHSIARTKCEQTYIPDEVTIKDIAPVLHKETNTVYRNIHCAVCNGITEEGVEVFESHFQCSTPITVENDMSVSRYIISSKYCIIYFEYSNISMLSFCPDSISSCNVTGRWIHYDPFYVKACASYASVINVDNSMFKNIHCALCNGISDIPRICSTRSQIHTGVSGYGLSGILNYAEDKDNPELSSKCPGASLFDQNMGTCVSVRCSPFRQLTNGQCKEAMRQVSRIKYTLYLRLTPFSTQTLKEAYMMTEFISFELPYLIEMELDHPIVDIRDIKVLLKTNDTCDTHTDGEYILMENYTLTDFFVKVVYMINSDHIPESHYEKLSNSSAFLIDNETISVSMVSGYDMDFDQSMPFYTYRDILPRQEGLYHVVFCSNLSNTMAIPVHVPGYRFSFFQTDGEPIPVASMTPCLLVEITPSVYPWVLTRDGIEFTENQLRFNHTQIYIDEENGTLFLCQDQYQMLVPKSATTDSKLTFDHIISIVCVSLSIISLIFTLITYSILKPLRSLPGKNIMSLTASLLIAQVSYLVGSFSRFGAGSVMCKAFGILTHFSFLQAIFWMNICTFHMFRCLTKTRRMIHSPGNKKFVVSHILCSTFASVFVTVNILVSSFSPESPGIGYGNVHCYISSRKMIMFTFAAPLLFVIISNIIMFIFVMIAVKKSSVIAKNASVERNDFAVLARLSTITGITWIFGFVFTWTQLSVFSIMFDLFSGGQGVFICVSFVCNKRVLNMIREKRSYLRASTQLSSAPDTLSTGVKSRGDNEC